jgi:hypothetical protein
MALSDAFGNGNRLGGKVASRVACKPLPEALHFGSVNLAKQYSEL